MLGDRKDKLGTIMEGLLTKKVDESVKLAEVGIDGVDKVDLLDKLKKFCTKNDIRGKYLSNLNYVINFILGEIAKMQEVRVMRMPVMLSNAGSITSNTSSPESGPSSDDAVIVPATEEFMFTVKVSSEPEMLEFFKTLKLTLSKDKVRVEEFYLYGRDADILLYSTGSYEYLSVNVAKGDGRTLDIKVTLATFPEV